VTGVGLAVQTHFQNLAADPPRDDFPSVSEYRPASHDSVISDDPESAVHAYAVIGEALCAALHALVTSLERHDGVRLALENGKTAYSKADLTTFDRLQRDAIAHNARVSSALIDRLVSNRGPLNAEYLCQIPATEREGTALAAPDHNARRRQLEELWHRGKADVQRRFSLSEIDMGKIESIWRQSLERSGDSSVPAGTLLDEKWESTMNAMSVELLRLADAYDGTAPSDT
jgi:hypothetical protein